MQRLGLPLLVSILLCAASAAPALAFHFTHRHHFTTHHACRDSCGDSDCGYQTCVTVRDCPAAQCPKSDAAPKAGESTEPASEASTAAPETKAEVEVVVKRACPSGVRQVFCDEADSQMDYVFHHLTGEQLARDRAELEAKGLIPAGATFSSPRFQKLIEKIRAGEVVLAPAAESKAKATKQAKKIKAKKKAKKPVAKAKASEGKSAAATSEKDLTEPPAPEPKPAK